MEIDGANTRREAWSSYWAAGNLHSCIGSYDGNYTGAIGKFWQEVMERLPGQVRVLDLATGNGALPLMLRDRHAQGEALDIHGVDQAAVAPPWYRADIHSGIAFHSGVEMENLPFPDRSFDLVVSQFGLEYARWPQAVREALRVARDDGAAAFVMHHPGSVLIGVGRVEMDHQQLLLAEDGLLDAARRVLPWLSRARRTGGSDARSVEALDARRTYNEAMALVSGLVDTSPVPDLLIEARAWVHGMLSAANGNDPSQPLAMLSEYTSSLQTALLRTREMIEHAVSPPALEQLLHALADGWPTHKVDCQVLSQEQGILGWAIQAFPPAQS